MIETDVIEKAIVVNKKEQILLLRRSKTDTRRPLQWDLPGGGHQEGESLEDGVLREVLEESGLKVSRLRPIYTKTEMRNWDDNTRNALFIFYTARSSTDEVELSFEHDKYRWVDIKEAINLISYYLHKELLQYIVNNKLAL